jgi:hypothetical protein
MDEKGFLIGVVQKSKRIFSRELFESNQLRNMQQDGSREWITTIACICADGTSLSPALIYQATSGAIQDTWLQDFDPAENQAFFTSSPSGWTNNELGLAWLKGVFDRETKAKARLAYRLLILDGHGSHITQDFIEFCDNNKILLAVLPPHSTHSLQPLDVGMFSPLAQAYSNQLASFMHQSQGLSSITKRDFYRLFNLAWKSSFIKTTILKSFKATGLSPFNPDVILGKFYTKQSTDDRPASSGSNSSVLSSSDWRKIEMLLREVVNDLYNNKTKKLSRTIHTISVRNDLLQHENQQLREALLNEKKRRKRGKALLLSPPEDYHGGAVFYSPKKVAEARDRQRQKDLELEVVQQQKDEVIKLREQRKLQKAEELEQRRISRAVKMEEQAKKKAQKVIDREEKLANQELQKQLQIEIKSSKKGNRRSFKPPKASEVIVVDENPLDEEEPLHQASRSGRTVRRPQRYMT